MGDHSQEIRDPEGIEEVTGTNLLFTMVLPQVEEFKHIRVPGLEIDGESTRTLVSTLIYIARGGVVCSKHRDDTVGIPVGPRNIRTKGQSGNRRYLSD